MSEANETLSEADAERVRQEEEKFKAEHNREPNFFDLMLIAVQVLGFNEKEGMEHGQGTGSSEAARTETPNT
jgi:hypothetical protein